MLYLWETSFSLWVLKQPFTPSNHQYRLREQTLTNRDERQCNSCSVEVFCRNTDINTVGEGWFLFRGPFFSHFCEMVWIRGLDWDLLVMNL